MPLFRLAAAALLATTAFSSAQAQTLLSGSYSIDGALCAGGGCTGTESFPQDADIKIKENDPRLLFEDASSAQGYATRDWVLKANQISGAAEYFALEDVDGNGEVLRIEGDTRANAIYVDAAGKVGFGTSMPLRTMHLMDGNSAAIRFDRDGSGGNTPSVWDMGHNGFYWYLEDVDTGFFPFLIRDGAPERALEIDNLGNVMIGNVGLASAKLHVKDTGGAAMAKIEEASTTSSPRTLLSLQNNGRPEIVMGNSNTGGEWSFGAGTNFILKQGLVGSTSAAKTKLFEVKANGDASITGTLTTGGTACGGGCDLVFTEDYDLPSISEHAEKMFSLGYLPNVGPTIEHAPINVSDKLGRMLNELEHAHIYIAELEGTVSSLGGEVARLKADAGRVAALEARLKALEAALEDH